MASPLYTALYISVQSERYCADSTWVIDNCVGFVYVHACRCGILEKCDGFREHVGRL